MKPDPDIAGLAALSICESLLLSMTDLEIIDRDEAHAILEDAATAHRRAMEEATNQQLHRDVVDLIERIIKGRNSTRPI
ncbi:hypothetical protein [Roseospirillum parvum]|uniref:Uncharacterized protein n=1 Tax=Roseospirillum parvum TaxID=83401 RepID=A0A1G8F465_9PROT|nr:hypothetical protein [Roseospirillum parvum]SDH76935.1 hypothetical protein SAMN05421742_11223 [Roseospirillum parvum]